MSDYIFVSIPSYKDEKCSATLDMLYKNARNPEKIFCGVFTQINPNNSKEFCSIKNSYIPQNNVRYIAVNHSKANGPMYARAMIMDQLYHNEKYMLWVDAHTIFTKDWDVRYKEYLDYLYYDVKIRKPILSGYPAGQNNDEDATYVNCKIAEHNDVWPLLIEAFAKPPGQYRKSYFLAAGCLFTYGKFYTDALNRTNFMNMVKKLGPIFNGEELILALIAFVHNWDIYSIPHSHIKHYYKSTDDKVDDGTNFMLTMTEENRDYLKYLVFSEKSPLNFQGKTVFDFYKTIGWSIDPDPELPWEQRWNQKSQEILAFKTKIIKYK